MEILEVRYGEFERPFLYPYGVSMIAVVVFAIVGFIAFILGDTIGAELLFCLSLLSVRLLYLSNTLKRLLHRKRLPHVDRHGFIVSPSMTVINGKVVMWDSVQSKWIECKRHRGRKCYGN